jgi:hypothetical protein
LDATRPPQIFIEQVAPCRDAAAAQAQLKDALAPALAPSASWTVRARFQRTGGRLVVKGDVIDGDDVTVATRTLSTSGSDCASLAKGLAVWASLVLDAEVERAKPQEPEVPAAPPAPPPQLPDASVWPGSQPAEPRSSDQDLFLAHSREQRTVELGLSTFVMGGRGGGAIIGPAAYGIFETAHGFFLRPTLLGGHSVGGLTATTEAPATFLASRFDACARLPGFYREGRGLQLDLCGGAELGFSRLDSGVVANAGTGAAGGGGNSTLPFVGLGPSLGLRGELGASLSAIIRGVAELSLLRDSVTVVGGSVVTPPLVSGRAEVGLSWSLR